MKLEAQRIITPPRELAKASMFCRRGILHYTEVLYVAVVLLCAFSILATCEPCPVSGLRDQLNSDACRSVNEDVLAVDVTSRPVSHNLVPHPRLDDICPDSNLFCFRSTLPGFLSSEPGAKFASEVSGVQSNVTWDARSDKMSNVSWSSNNGIFWFSGGRTISCSSDDQKGCHDLPCDQTKSDAEKDVSSCRKPALDLAVQHLTSEEDGGMRKSGILDRSSLHLEISPSLLDWGQKYLYFPSLAFLTIRNIHSDNILTVYEPSSTSYQFYPCNCSEFLLAPGEIASICFVYLPTVLGLSSAQLVLQTSSGGYLVHATGFALESPYGIQPLVGLEVPSSGKWRKNLSLFNPFNDALQVEEVTAWISVSSGSTSQLTKAVCSISNDENHGQFHLHSVKEWIDVKDELGVPVISMKPHSNWEIGSQKNETIMELDFSLHSKAKLFGAFCMRLAGSSKEKSNTIMVPLEAEFGRNTASDDLFYPVSASLEALVKCEISSTSVSTLSLRNHASHMLSVVKISLEGEKTQYFHIKWMERLVLFPGTVTQVAVIFYSPLEFGMAGPLPESSEMDMNCELVILTNDSRNSQLKLPCRTVVNFSSRHTLHSSVGYVQGSEEVQYENTRKTSSGSKMHPLLLNEEALNTTEADELVLKSWKSQATANGMSVVDDHEVVFPVVQLGSHSSQFVNVKNPSQQPVVMQLILNSAEIIDECKTADEHFRPFFSNSLIGNKSISPSRYGFSIAEGALTEAFVHPFGNASLGPIVFQPSNRCVLRSSVLIRNNLSGVDWLSLQGSGGLLSLVLFEDSKLANSLDFKLGLPTSHSLSSPDFLLPSKVDIDACLQPSSKELYVKNMGDLPFEVKRIGVSGSECSLDGFAVQNCKGFALEPGESTKLIITYQTDFSVATVQRDLELALTTGIFVIPMKATLSMHMLGVCRKSIFWMRVKRSFITILLVAFFFFLVLCCFLPHVMSLGTRDHILRSRKSSTATYGGKSSHAHRSQKTYNKFPLSNKMNDLLRSIGEDKSLLLESLGRYSDCEKVVEEKISSAKNVKSSHELKEQPNCLLGNGKESTVSFPSMEDSAAVKSCDIQDTAQSGNLTVKTGKDKGRRRRKKRSSGAGISGLIEVASSQSGNSTPSSPLSPVSSFTHKRLPLLSSDVDQSVQARNPFSLVANRLDEKHANSEPKPKVTRLQLESPLGACNKKNWCVGNFNQEKSAAWHKTNGSIFVPSATFPSAGTRDQLFSCSSPLASTSSIAPHDRAPGSRLHDLKKVKPKVTKEVEENFTYDIWGDHIFALPLTGRPKPFSGAQSHATESNSDSFFVRDPQALMTIAQSKSVSGSDQAG